LGVRGPKSKIEEYVLYRRSWRTDGQKNGSIPSRKNKEEQFEFFCDRQTDRQSQLLTIMTTIARSTGSCCVWHELFLLEIVVMISDAGLGDGRSQIEVAEMRVVSYDFDHLEHVGHAEEL